VKGGRISSQALEFFVSKQAGTAAEIERIFPSLEIKKQATAAPLRKMKAEAPRQSKPVGSNGSTSDRDWWKTAPGAKRPLL